MAPFRHRSIFCVWPKNVEDNGLSNAEEVFDCSHHPDGDRYYDRCYLQLPTVEPLSEDMVRLVRSQLATMFYECMAYGLVFTSKFRLAWSQYCYDRYCTRSFNLPRLPPRTFTPHSRPVRDHLLEYADVHIAVYFNWFDSRFFYAQAQSDFEIRRLGRYVQRKWFYLHGGRPPMLGYQMFAKPIGLEGSEPRDIQNVREFHRSLCDAVSIGLNEQEIPKPSSSTYQTRLQPRNPSPPPSTNLRTYKEKGREIAHLFRAIVIVVDDQVMQYAEPTTCAPKMEGKLPYSERLRSWFTAQNSVLLIKTGDDAHLSSPISFQSFYDSGTALPVNRPDCDDEADVIRVKIDTALEFIFDLIQRERERVPSVGLAAEIEDRQHLEVCERWVDSVMEHAGKVGIDANGFTWEAVRRAKAALNGEAFHKNQIDPQWHFLGEGPMPPFHEDVPSE